MNIPGERLSKRVMQLRGCSRSEAEQAIEGGWVRVDGVVVEDPPHRVRPEQNVSVDAQASRLDLAPVTLLLHKPPEITDLQALLKPELHWTQAPTQERVLKRHVQRTEFLLPLEGAASGLLVATQDWRVARKLKDTLLTLEHEVLVDVAGNLSGEGQTTALARIAQALNNPRQPMPSVRCSVNSSQADHSRLRFAVKGAHPGLIAYLCEQAGLQMLAMRRTRLGRVALGNLPAGRWRYLAPHERF